MKFIFNIITSIAVRFRLLTLVMVVVLLGLGITAANDLNQELLPPIEFPQTVILAQSSGMTSEQVLTILTERMEAELDAIPDIINLDSQTTGAFGGIIIAYNDFGIDQARLRGEIRAALNNVWLPQRSIIAPADADPTEFAAGLLSDLSGDALIYLTTINPNLPFQLSPDVWDALSDDAVRTLIAYLAQQTETVNQGSALERLVAQEISPQLNTIEAVAGVEVSGGQALPGEEVDALLVADESAEAASQLLRIAPDIWTRVAARFDDLNDLDDNALDVLNAESITIPETAPALPSSWGVGFTSADDLIEIETLTAPVPEILNSFWREGEIVGALGQTDDLTPEIVERMLEIEPTMVEYFEAEHLVAMSPDVFAVLPDEFINDLDGFTRDELAAAALAQTITGETLERAPVPLPDPWRIQPPQIITFSFADIPLAAFSVASTSVPSADAPQIAEAPDPDEDAALDGAGLPDDSEETPVINDVIPEGPPLPPIFQLIGAGFDTELNTADDLIAVPLPDELAEASGIATLSAADLFNFIVDPPDFGDEGGFDASAFPFDPGLLISSLNADVIAFIAEYDPTFLTTLSPVVYDRFSDEVLALPMISPPLADVWDILGGQPQFADSPLRAAEDLLRIGDGRASDVLNTINANIPDNFVGYEVRLFDSLTPGVMRYLAAAESDLYTNLDSDILLKLSPDVLDALPGSVLAALDDDIAGQVRAIASGEANSAFADLRELYATNIPPADPNAPPLNVDWAVIAPFYNIELDSADDFFRFPDNFPFEDASAFINSIFDSAQGINFAPSLMGNLPVEAVEYMVARDASVLENLRVEALQLMTDEALEVLPEALQERAASDGQPFIPVRQVTRTDGSPSLFVTVFKDADANTVTTYKEVEALMREIDAANDDIAVGVVFEQSSFIEDSISGVAREGGLGAVFAVIIILVFLSGGRWARSSRQIVGIAVGLIAMALLAGLTFSGLDAAGGDWNRAFAETDIIFRVLLMAGVVAGLLIFLWPGNLPDPAWRATIVIAVSIPLSILTSLVVMRWFSPFMHGIISPLAEGSAFFTFVLRLFPEELTLNIMTLSGLTVAVGRIVDDSIVVLENIFRQIQAGGDKREAILTGTRDVSAAIFTATLIAVIVFLPLGLTGGLIGAFFLPFGLAVTYALLGSFTVALTVVPALAYVFIDADDVPEEQDLWVAQFYLPVLRWALSSNRSKSIVLGVAILSMFFGFFLLSQRPAAFLPQFGEPQVTVDIQLPPSSRIIETNERVVQLEQFVADTIPAEQISTIQTTVGGGGAGFESFFAGSGVTESRANVVIGLGVGQNELTEWTRIIREEAEIIFGESYVTVSASTIGGDFGGFELVVAGPQEELAVLDPIIIETLNNIDGITNVSSNLSEAAADADGPATFVRVNRESAASYSAELETENTIGITREAIEVIRGLPELSDNIRVSEGFQSEVQTEGFNSLPIAMGIAIVIVVGILIVSFGSLVYWMAIILSIVVAPVGAAIALTITDRVLGISALIGLLMLLGLVVTNAVVLIDRVRSNRNERGMDVYDALIEAGARRLRPILMTSLATIIALTPLAIGLSDGAIIASELGTVVIGGIFSSTLLTLIVVPTAYSVFYPLHKRLSLARGDKNVD